MNLNRNRLLCLAALGYMVAACAGPSPKAPQFPAGMKNWTAHDVKMWCVGRPECTAFVISEDLGLRKTPDATAPIALMLHARMSLKVHPVDVVDGRIDWIRVIATDARESPLPQFYWSTRRGIEAMADFKPLTGCWWLASARISFGDYAATLTFDTHGTGIESGAESPALHVVVGPSRRFFGVLRENHEISTIFFTGPEGSMSTLGIRSATYFAESDLKGCEIPQVVKEHGGETLTFPDSNSD